MWASNAEFDERKKMTIKVILCINIHFLKYIQLLIQKLYNYSSFAGNRFWSDIVTASHILEETKMDNCEKY